jgi:methylmalonyl-CoA mutase N-terminal domain/subunit
VVGVNAYVEDDSDPIEILKVTAEAERSQRERMARLRARRDQQLVDSRLAALADAARAGHNVIPAMLDAARAYCTLFEIRQVLEEIWGSYREPVFF